MYQHLEYMAFGETFVEEHSNTDRTPYLFNGKELDEETGLYYYGARYYDARTSVWQSVDPLSEKYPGWNSYNYCKNNPIMRIDPDGADDYFNTDGVLVKSTETGTNIYIQTDKGDVLFSQLQSDTKQNRQTLANITGYYGRQVGIKGTIGVGSHKTSTKDKDGAIAYNKGDGIYVNIKGGINPLLDDYNNLKNSLVHEKDHKSKGHGFMELQILNMLKFTLLKYKIKVLQIQQKHLRRVRSAQ